MFRHSVRFAITLSVFSLTLAGFLGPNAAAQETPVKPPAVVASTMTPAVQALIDAGDKAMDASRYPDAQRSFEQALTTARAAHDRPGEAWALKGIGVVHFHLGQTQKAVAFCQQALTICQRIGYTSRLIPILEDLAFIYRSVGQPQKALDACQQGLPLAREIGNKVQEISLLTQAGQAYWELGQWQKAADYAQQILVFAQQAGDKPRIASALTGIGLAYRNAGDWPKALDYLQQALLARRQLGDKPGQQLALIQIGWVYSTLGQPQKALDTCQQALTLAQQTNDESGQVGRLTDLAGLYWTLGQPQKALACHQQVIAIAQQTGDKRGEGLALSGIGFVYNNLGQPQKGLDYFQQLLPIIRQLGDKAWESNALNNIALIFRGLGQPEKSLEAYQQALTIAQQIGNKREEADILYGIGDVYLSLGQPQKALEYHQQVLTLAQQYGDTMMSGGKFNGLGAVYLTLGQPQKALEYYQKAVTAARQNGDKQAEAWSLANMGWLYLTSGRNVESETVYRQSLTQFEQIRANLNLDAQTRATYNDLYLGSYQGLLAALLNQNTPAKIQEAFTLIQQMKGRSLAELLAGRVTLDAQLTPEEKTMLRALRAVCDQLNTRIVAEGVTNEIGSKKRTEALKTELEKAERDLSVFTDQLYTRYPEASAFHTAQAATAKQVADALPKGVALIEFIAFRTGELGAFVTTHNGRLETFANKLPIAERAKAIADLRAAMVDPRVGDGEGWKAPARTLYDALIAPIEKAGWLKGVSRLVICPSGPVWDVPFAALLDAKNRPLLTRFTLTQAQSATLYLTARDHATKQAAARPKNAGGRGSQSVGTNATILAMADPAFAEYKSGFGNDPALPGQRPLPSPDRPITAPDRPLPVADRPIPAADRTLLLPESLRGGRLSALPGTRREADAIHATFLRASVFVGSQAQESTFKQLAPQARFLHLATHGFVNDTSPLLSSLVLAEPPTTGPGSNEDGFLTARELLDLDLSHVEMTVLSACNTARGQNQSGEGVVGLTWALFAAGCPTQVLSQWAVNDASTATLMEQFYTNLKAGKPKAEALRQAALTVSGNPATTHPYYWAPFVLVGSGE